MAFNTSKTGFPAIPLTAGMKLQLEARSTTTDAAVSGVSASLWAIYGYQTVDTGPSQEVVPLYTAEQIGTA